MAPIDAREQARRILERVEQGGAYSTLLLQNLDDDSLDARDIGLVTELVYGVLRRRLRLDHVLAAHCSRPLEQVERGLLVVLRLALYQILFLDRIPAHAAVSEAVKMARRQGRHPEAAAGFVNGVLRGVLRRSDAPGESPAGDPADVAGRLSLSESFPRPLVEAWLDRFGETATGALLSAMNRPAPLSVRVLGGGRHAEEVAASLRRESVITCASPLLPDFLRVESGTPQRTEAFRQGEIYIQDEASALVAEMVLAPPGARVLDACSAPGGKAILLAGRVGGSGRVVAADLHPSRLRLLQHNARRLGMEWCLPVAADLAGAAPFRPEARFDAVLVDAPCSGTGVIRRHPETRYRFSRQALAGLTRLQRALLDKAADLVEPGGALVYSVCSLEPEEGQNRITAFLAEHPRFRLEDPRPSLPAAVASLFIDGGPLGGCLRTLPHRDDLDGFFAARMVRQR